MEKLTIKNSILFLIICYSMFFVICALGVPIFAHFQNYNLSAKLQILLFSACHQNPERSFWLLGYPLGLCCRCLGVYIGCIAGFFIKFSKFILCLIGLSLIDIVLNVIAIDTGNVTRFFAGIFTGIAIIQFIKYILKGKKL
mgnify:CR=1 FL=1